jgi:hypothetical protein
MSNTAIDWLTRRFRVQRRIDPQVLRLRMGLDEQRTAALRLERLHHLPGVFLVLLGIGADQADGLVAEVAGGPDRTELRMHEVGAATGVRDLADIDQAASLSSLVSTTAILFEALAATMK